MEIKMKIIAGVLLFIFAFGSLASAQSPEGALVGTVSDATGARIVAATVTVSAKTYSLSRTVKTGKVGEFTVEQLPPGEYEVKVDAAGFASQTGKVTVAVTSTPSMNIRLRPAAVQQS